MKPLDPVIPFLISVTYCLWKTQSTIQYSYYRATLQQDKLGEIKISKTAFLFLKQHILGGIQVKIPLQILIAIS